MTYLRVLWRVELAALAALLLSSTLLALFAFAQVAWWDAYGKASLIDAPSTFRLVLVYAVIFGAVPALFVGAPAYAWLKQKQQASWLLALCLGVAPGSILLWIEPDLGVWLIFGGVLAATLTHAFCTKLIGDRL